jgi:selenium metabolism protein YedF
MPPMPSRKLDCRGLACPHPVLKIKELVDQGETGPLTVLVDNPAAKENVSRFLERSGFMVKVAEQDGGFAITGTRQPAGDKGSAAEKGAATAGSRTLILIGTDRLGTGDEILGARLLANFIATLKEMGQDLWCVVLLNAGVKLAVSGSPVLESLQALTQSGVMLLVCGTCLNHFQLLEEKQVGETTNMLDIVTHMQLADKVISLT